MAVTRVLVPSGVLGLGFDSKALQLALKKQPDIICIDGGSTDSGPFSLGSGTSKYSRSACKSEWKELMLARQQANVPLLISTCGTCGTDSTVDWMLEITRELCEELGQSLRVATLYSSQDKNVVAEAFTAGNVHQLQPAVNIDEAGIQACSNIVALAGVEQLNAALETGAQIILAGRATDTAVIAALPLSRGANPGACWHGAKIAECGALCSTNPTSGVIMVEFDETGFTVEPMGEDAQCTPHSVSAHMLYENADPFLLHEPGGVLDVTNASYTAVNERKVRVEGSQWRTSPTYTVKLEGATLAGYQSTIMAVLRDAHYVQNAQQWVDKLTAFLRNEISVRMSLAEDSYDIEFRLIGVNSVLGQLETQTNLPNEVGVLGIVTASTAQLAKEISRLINPFVLHYPLSSSEELPTFAFPFSPADSLRGELYEFSLNHVMVLDDPMSVFDLNVHEVGS